MPQALASHSDRVAVRQQTVGFKQQNNVLTFCRSRKPAHYAIPAVRHHRRGLNVSWRKLIHRLRLIDCNGEQPVGPGKNDGDLA